MLEKTEERRKQKRETYSKIEVHKWNIWQNYKALIDTSIYCINDKKAGMKGECEHLVETTRKDTLFQTNKRKLKPGRTTQ